MSETLKNFLKKGNIFPVLSIVDKTGKDYQYVILYYLF